MTDTRGTGLLADRVCTYEISHSLNHYKKIITVFEYVNDAGSAAKS